VGYPVSVEGLDSDKAVQMGLIGGTTSYDLAKARGLELVTEQSQIVTLASGQNLIHGSAMANGKLFLTTRTSPAWFIRCNNLEDLNDRTAFQFAGDGFHVNGDACTYVAETDRVYVLFDHAGRTTVAEVNPTTLARSDVISDTSNPSGTSGSICSDGTNLYILTATSPAKVLKYRLSDFSLQGTATLTSRNTGHAILYDGVNVYAVGQGTPCWIARITTSDMTFTDALFPTGVTTLTDDIASVGDYLFVAREAAAQQLIRANKTDLTTEVMRVPGIPSNSAFALHFDGTWIWVGLNSTPGTLVRVDPHSGQGAFHTLASGEDGANEILSDGKRLFVTFWLSPAKVKRLVPPAMPSPGLPVTSISTQHASDTTGGTSEETLLTYAIPGSTLGTDGDALRITATGTFAANANNKRILLKFGLASPVTVFDTGSLAFNGANWWLEAICIRTGASAQDWVTKWISDSSLLATKVQHAATTQTDTGTLNINVRGHSPSAAGEVTNESLLVEVVN
jgi:hypothetical protein